MGYTCAAGRRCLFVVGVVVHVVWGAHAHARARTHACFDAHARFALRAGDTGKFGHGGIARCGEKASTPHTAYLQRHSAWWPAFSSTFYYYCVYASAYNHLYLPAFFFYSSFLPFYYTAPLNFFYYYLLTCNLPTSTPYHFYHHLLLLLYGVVLCLLLLLVRCCGGVCGRLGLNSPHHTSSAGAPGWTGG